VITNPNDIEIVPSDPQVIYVPTYQPDQVYYQSSNGSPFITFGIGWPIGLWLDGDFDWGNHHIIIWGRDHPRPSHWWQEPTRQRNWGQARVWSPQNRPGGVNASLAVGGGMHGSAQFVATAGTAASVSPHVPHTINANPKATPTSFAARPGVSGAAPQPDRHTLTLPQTTQGSLVARPGVIPHHDYTGNAPHLTQTPVRPWPSISQKNVNAPRPLMQTIHPANVSSPSVRPSVQAPQHFTPTPHPSAPAGNSGGNRGNTQKTH
jgi:hypothetical protein